VSIRHHEIPSHWNYFLCIEKDIERLSRYIEFSEANEKVYSIELARLLMTASAEADVIVKALCRAINPNSSATSINAYQIELLAAFPMLPSAEVSLPRYGLTFHPWTNWKDDKNPPAWWTGNNKVKHHRSEKFTEANLKNVLNSVAALLALLLLFYDSKQHTIYPLVLPDGVNVPWCR